jgi:hypothetical protein
VTRDALVDLIEENVQLDVDVILLCEQAYALHGYIAYDGAVVVATFATVQEARAELARLGDLLSPTG